MRSSTSLIFFAHQQVHCIISWLFFFFFSSRRRHTRFDCDWSSDVCSSDLNYLHERLIALDEIALVLEPLVDGALGHGFAELGHLDLRDGHPLSSLTLQPDDRGGGARPHIHFRV